MKFGRVVLLALLGLNAAGAQAGDSLPQLAAAVRSDGGALVLEVTGVAPDTSDWLAVRFLLPGGDMTAAGPQSVYSVKGEFRLPVPVPAGYEKGSYDVGLWKERVAEGTVSVPQGLKAYGEGGVATGPKVLRLADSLAELKTEVFGRDGRKVLRVSGKARDDRWLTVTFRKSGVPAESSSVLLSISRGEFSPALAVPAGFESGSYVASLWVRFGQGKKTSRLAGELGHVSGQVSP